MSWARLQARQQAAVFAALGHDAQWEGVGGTVRVLLRDEDALLGQTVVDAVQIRVRRSEVEAPRSGQLVTVAGANGDERRFELIGTPLLDRKATWRCEAAPASDPVQPEPES